MRKEENQRGDKEKIERICRKSQRLLFRDTRNAIAERNIPLAKSDSLDPYGRVVELINPKERKEEDFVSKVLFLGCVGLTFKEKFPVGGDSKPSSPEVVQMAEDKIGRRRNGFRRSPKTKTVISFLPKTYSIPSLKHLCTLAVVKPLKREYERKELEYFDMFKMPEVEGSREYNLGKYMKKLIKKESGLPPVLRLVDPPLDLEVCIRKLQRCGSRVEFSSHKNVPPSLQSLVSIKGKSITRPAKNEKWHNWSSHMDAVLKSSDLPKLKPMPIIRKRRATPKSARSKSRKV